MRASFLFPSGKERLRSDSNNQKKKGREKKREEKEKKWGKNLRNFRAFSSIPDESHRGKKKIKKKPQAGEFHWPKRSHIDLNLDCFLQLVGQWLTRSARLKIFFLTGVGLLLGWQSMWQLFTKKANLKGSIPFFLGLFLLFVRWPIAGIIMELYGSFVLFSGFGPPIQAFLYQIPVVGWLLQYPFQLFGQLRRKRA